MNSFVQTGSSSFKLRTLTTKPQVNVQQELFGIHIDAIRMQDAILRLREWIGQPDQVCRYVVTPNVDHAVLLQENAQFRQAYAMAGMILADGHPIVWASRLLGKPLPERVAGSELVPCLFDSFNQDFGRQKLRVFLLGAATGVATRAATQMKKNWPNIETVGVYSPPMGFEKDADETNLILGRIALCRPDVVVVGLGAPKQELWVHQHREQIHASVALCVGATIDFLAGEKKRAPRWMQRTGIEWLHRMCSEPKRLVKRYAKDAWIFPQLIWQQFTDNRNAHSASR
jgi:N-acetylglucosaminyldiphosphoundecaprenol N-acetyl-beta-D-mannosaminyltransferase